MLSHPSFKPNGKIIDHEYVRIDAYVKETKTLGITLSQPQLNLGLTLYCCCSRTSSNKFNPISSSSS
uniref:Uncharacterized protein n=1 Tax=Rhizophora mucronata TaxID=61149 RepID=A0A2P2PSH2_RHIMU